jgi:hypothetical protein
MTDPVAAPRTAMLCGPWASVADLPESMLGDKAPDQWERWLLVASEILFGLSGEQWRGVGCTFSAELRGHPPEQGSGAWPYYRSWGMTNTSPAYWWYPLGAVAWFPIYREVVPRPYAVRLPHDEVTEILSVTVNGTALDPSLYRLARGNWLERTDGLAWGQWFDQTVVSYSYGRPPPESGVQAVIVLANEIGKAECGDKDCRLPKRVTSITRQGVSIAVIDSMDFFKIGKTGLADVDMWLTSVNPKARRRRAQVWSPDIPRMR